MNDDRRDHSISRDMSDALQASPVDLDDTDPRVFAAVQEYVAELDAGRRPNRHEFLARFPEIKEDLSICLQGLAFLNSAVAEMDGSGPSIEQQRTFDAELASSKHLGDFKLIREIGRGGMGVVYEAVQLSLGRRVAVKVLPLAGALDHKQLQRFRNEAQSAAQLHHTNIVPVYAVGCERSVHFYAMQLIDGQSLDDVIRLLRGVVDHDRAAGCLLGAHVSQRAEHIAGLRETAVRVNVSEAEVGNPQGAALIQQQVRRFDVAMNHAELVGVLECLAGLNRKLRDRPKIRRRLGRAKR